MRKAAKYVLIKAVSIFLGYIFLRITFGLLLQKPGLGMGQAFLINALIRAGSIQFILVGILAGGLSFITTAVMTLFISNRHAFYGLTFIQWFREMERTYPYMVFSLTNETYSLLCSMARPSNFTGREWKAAVFFTTLSDQCYWAADSVMSALMGELIRFGATGIDFAMTALFVATYMNQWKAAGVHIPIIIGFTCSTLFLMPTRSSNFILPALAATVAFLLFLQKAVKKKMEETSP